MADATASTTTGQPGGKLRFVLVTHDRKLLDVECDEVSLPGVKGYFGVLPGHTPLLALTKVGEGMYRVGKREHYIALAGGFAEVANDVVTALVDAAELPEEIDVPKAERALREAEETMRVASDVELERARVEVEASVTRIQVARRPR